MVKRVVVVTFASAAAKFYANKLTSSISDISVDRFYLVGEHLLENILSRSPDLVIVDQANGEPGQKADTLEASLISSGLKVARIVYGRPLPVQSRVFVHKNDDGLEVFAQLVTQFLFGG